MRIAPPVPTEPVDPATARDSAKARYSQARRDLRALVAEAADLSLAVHHQSTVGIGRLRVERKRAADLVRRAQNVLHEIVESLETTARSHEAPR